MLIHLRKALLLQSLSFLKEAGAFQRFGTLTGLLFFVIFTLFLTTPVLAATPIGTQINNIAHISYNTGNITGFSLSSNTDQFSVSGLGQTDSAVMTVTQSPVNSSPRAGDTLTFNISILNKGDNTLSACELLTTVPKGSIVDADSESLVSSNAVTAESGSVETTHAYPLKDILSFETLELQATVTLPIDITPGAISVSFELETTSGAISIVNVPLSILNRTAGTLELLQYNPGGAEKTLSINTTEYDNGSGFVPLSPPAIPDNSSLNVTDQPLPLITGNTFSHDQTLFFMVTDADQNTDPLSPDTVIVDLAISNSVEGETLRLTETEVNSGVFAGYITLSNQAGSRKDGSLNIQPDDQFIASYTDDVESSDTAISIALVDPYGVIFDSSTGELLDGFTVRLVNAATGQDAIVYGDDGVSIYDSTLISGGTASDSSGKTYDLPQGTYRFPFISPGQYYLEVTPPAGSNYRFPSSKNTSYLTSLPNGPFVIDVGSRGEVFTVSAGPPLHIDVPADPVTSALYVRRSASKTEVSQGDFIQFKVSVENTSSAMDMLTGKLTDTLPAGFSFQKGSARIRGSKLADPQFTHDGRTMTFALGTLAAATTYEVSYVAGVGAARPGTAQSRSIARANSGAVVSNTSSIDTVVKNAFMRDHNVLAGRVSVHDEEGNPSLEGVSGVRIYMEDGTYTVTDEKGRYHFEGIKPGTHVVQLDLDTLPVEYEIIPFVKNTRSAGRAWSRFVDLQGGTLWKVDFHAVRKPKPTGKLTVQMKTEGHRKPGMLEHRIMMNNIKVPLTNIKIMVMLPEGTKYKPLSSRMGSLPYIDPEGSDGVLTYRIDKLLAGTAKELTFKTVVSEESSGELITKSMLIFDSPEKSNQRTPVMSNRVERTVTGGNMQTLAFILRPSFAPASTSVNEGDMYQLDHIASQLSSLENIRISAVGHTDSTTIHPRSRGKYPDNKTLSKQRALTVANYLRDRLNLPPEKIIAMGKGSSEPLADNGSEEGRAANRRVELIVIADKAIKQKVTSRIATPGKPVEIITAGSHKEIGAEEIRPKNEEPSPVTYDKEWLSTAEPGVEWLSPAENALPATPGVTIAVKHNKDQLIETYLNNQPVPEIHFEGTDRNHEGTSLSRWRGVDLIEGDNLLEVTILSTGGSILANYKRVIHYSAPPVEAVLVPGKSVLTADGITSPVITLRLTDRDGYPARREVIGTYRISSPYEPADDNKFNPAVLPGSPEKQFKYTVGKNGLARIKLRPTSKSGEVQITLPLMSGEQTVTARLTSPTRDWIIVGFAEGTAGYNTLSGKIEALEGKSGEEHLYYDGKVSFFAKGRIKGEWLLTIAYDSEKESLKKDMSLFQTIDPGTYYTVYGDNSTQSYDAASREQLYLKLERKEFYLLFGDYNTNISSTKLSKYNRALTGIKSEYHDKGFDIVLFGSESNQAFIRDEFLGKGITGPYYLSRSSIVMNSEKVFIETRDRFRSELIVQSRELARHTDYDIDYMKGSLVFRTPVMQNDESLNHNFIVVKYESYDEDDLSYTYGGRIKKKINSHVTVGVTHINEGRLDDKAKISGADAALKITDSTTVRAEVARSKETDNTKDDSGKAYSLGINHRAEKWNSSAYYNKTEENFGLDQTNGSEAGTRKIGIDAAYCPVSPLHLNGSIYEQENLETDAVRTVIEGKGKLQLKQSTISLGLKSARDKLGNDDVNQSHLLTAGATRTMLDGKLTVSLDREQSVGSRESVDFPDITRLGADYRLTEKTSVLVQQEWTEGKEFKSQQTKLGLKTRPWQGGELFTGLRRSLDSNADTTSADAALKQKWMINELWSMDFGLEKSKTLTSKPVAPFNSNVPFAYGGSDYTAGSMGATYNPGDWIWTARLEGRDGASEDLWSLATSAQTDQGRETSYLASFKVLDSKNDNGEHRSDMDIRLDMAYRPLGSAWTILDRLELITETITGSDSDYENWRIVNNINTNYYGLKHWQLALQLGIKYLQETIDTEEYDSVLALYGAEARYDITEKWDVGPQFSVLHSYRGRDMDYSAGISIGHSFMDNVWVSLGYNFIGFYDRDFSRSRSTSQGIYLKFRMKFDQQSAGEIKEWINDRQQNENK